MSSSGNQVLYVSFNSELGDWKDKYNNQYVYDIKDKNLKWQQEKRKLTRHWSFKEFGVEDFRYNLQTVGGFKNINVMSKTEYTSTKPLWHELGWFSSTKDFLDTKLNSSDKYYYEEIRITVIDGPFKLWLGRGAIICNVYFAYISLNKINDSDLEEKALEFLYSIEYTGDWGERVERNNEDNN